MHFFRAVLTTNSCDTLRGLYSERLDLTSINTSYSRQNDGLIDGTKISFHFSRVASVSAAGFCLPLAPQQTCTQGKTLQFRPSVQQPPLTTQEVKPLSVTVIWRERQREGERERDLNIQGGDK